MQCLQLACESISHLVLWRPTTIALVPVLVISRFQSRNPLPLAAETHRDGKPESESLASWRLLPPHALNRLLGLSLLVRSGSRTPNRARKRSSAPVLRRGRLTGAPAGYLREPRWPFQDQNRTEGHQVRSITIFPTGPFPNAVRATSTSSNLYTESITGVI